MLKQDFCFPQVKPAGRAGCGGGGDGGGGESCPVTGWMKVGLSMC